MTLGERDGVSLEGIAQMSYGNMQAIASDALALSVGSREVGDALIHSLQHELISKICWAIQEAGGSLEGINLNEGNLCLKTSHEEYSRGCRMNSYDKEFLIPLEILYDGNACIHDWFYNERARQEQVAKEKRIADIEASNRKEIQAIDSRDAQEWARLQAKFGDSRPTP